MIPFSVLRSNSFGILLVFVSSFTALAVKAQEDAATAKPNVLFILADDVGRDAIGCYGGESYATPVIDELARTGKKFEHCYSMAVCHPSRTCLLSGQYPARLKNPAWGSFPVEVESRALGSVMKAAGYATAVAGKWQMCLLKEDLDQPERLGFDEWALFGWHEGPRFRSPMIYHNGEVMKDTEGKYGPDLYVDFLIDFIKRQHKAAKPFFAYYPMALAHDVTDDIGEPVPFFADGKWETFGEMVESMDRQIGRLVTALDELGVRDNTLIVYTTDNGSPKASYLTVDEDGKFVRPKVTSKYKGKVVVGGKGELTDWGTRVPLVANWPGKIIEGSRSDALIDFADFLPTFAELGEAPLARLSAGARLDGVSFLPTILGVEESGRAKPFAYAEHGGVQFVRNHDWKLYSTGSFYDLRNDADERVIKPLKGAELSDAEEMIRHQLSGFLEVLPKAKGKTKPGEKVQKVVVASKDVGLEFSLVHENSFDSAGKGDKSLANQVADGEQIVPGWRALPGVDGEETGSDHFLVRMKSDMQNFGIRSSRVERTPQGWGVVVEFDESGSEQFAKLSTNAGRQLAIILDGEVLSTPVFHGDQPITGPVQISGNFDHDDARALADALSGKNPLKSSSSWKASKRATNLEVFPVPPSNLSTETLVFEKRGRSLFDGKTLDGWRGVDGAWEVRDGAIWCTGRKDGGRNWLIYEGQVPDDFVLELEYQFVAGNSGVQVRSAEIEEPFNVRGYQVEIAAPEKMGLWHHSLSPSKLRSHLATAGQSAVYAESGEKKVKQLQAAKAVQAHCRSEGWNSLKVTVIDSTFIQEINDSWFVTLTDDDSEHARNSGVIALQDHGKGTVAGFRKIRLRPLKENG